MSNAITALLIQIKADATQAIQSFKNIATGTTEVGQAATAASASASQALNTIGQSAEKASGHVRGLTYYFRSGMDSLRFALYGGNNMMAGFYAADEGIRALLASGMGLGTLVPVIGGVAAAIGGVVFGLHEWNKGEEDAKKNAKDLADAWKSLPGIIKQLSEMQQAGLLTAKQAGEYADYATGRKKLYVDENGKPTTSPTRTVSEPEYISSPEGVMVPTGASKNVTQNNQQATREQAQSWAMDQATAGGTITKEYLDAVKEAKELIEKSNEDALTGLAKQKAVIQDTYGDQRQEMAKTLNELTAHMTDAQVANSKLVADLRQAITENSIAEQNAIAAAEHAAKEKQVKQQLQQAQQAVDQIADQQRRQQDADRQHEAELQRQAQLTRDIHRSDLEDQIESVNANALLTAQQKLQITTALNAQQKSINNAEIAELEKLKSQVKTLSDQLELEEKIAKLKHDNNRINEQETPQQHNSFGYQFGKASDNIQDQWTGWATESANAFQKSWDGATNGVSAGLTHLFEYGAQRGQWFQQIWNGVIGSMISSTTNLVVDWVSKHIVMQGVSMAFHAVENALTAESVAAHEAGETAKTASTSENSLLRSVIRTAETTVHNVLVAMRVAVHVAGEVASTIATQAGAMLRAIAHAIAAAVGAMESESSVPYIGPILGVAAGAAMMAAAMGLMGGFKAGGYTGDGHPDQIMGIVHAGEYVVPAHAVNSSTMPILAAIRNGSLMDAVAPHVGGGTLPAPPSHTRNQGATGGSQTNIHNAVYFDKNQMVNTLQQSDAHEKYIVDIMARNIHKFKS